MERTVVIIKPDGIKRGLVGEIISRFERAGLKLSACKMIKPDKELAAKLYLPREDFLKGLGEKTLKTYAEYKKDVVAELGTGSAMEIGKMVRGWLIDYLCSGPVVITLLEGFHAVDNVRRLVGNTVPLFAQPGTIRGDFSLDAPDLANSKKRGLKNLVHASGNLEEAQYEEELLFSPKEIQGYERAEEKIMFE